MVKDRAHEERIVLVFLMSSSSTLLNEELAELPGKVSKVPHAELVACHPSMVQIKVRLVQNVLGNVLEVTSYHYFNISE